MTHQNQSTDLNEAVQLLADNGFEGMAKYVAKRLSQFASADAPSARQ